MKISIQSSEHVRDLGFDRAYELYRKAGFEAIDWNIDALWNRSKVSAGDLSEDCILAHPLDEILAYVSPELQAIERNHLTITQAHAPFPAYTPAFPELLDYAIPIYQNCILLCHEVGCKNLVIHGITLASGGGREEAALEKKLNMKLYSSLIPTLRQTDVTVCLENLFMSDPLREGVCSDPHEALTYIDALNQLAGKRCFGLCLDTGHLNLLRKNIDSYIRILGDRICALHIHDNNGDADSHLAPFAGSVNWRAFYTALKEIGYAGDLSFETFNQTSVRRRMELDFVPLYLRLIHDIGVEFRNKIEE